MTETEWLACTDPRLLLVYIEGQASGRKARLFACGVGRSLWPYLGDERSRRVVEVAEQYADSLATKTELAEAEEAALDARRGAASHTARWVGDHGPWQAARMTALSIQQAQTEGAAKDWSSNVIGRARLLLHCVFGNPFRPVTLDPTWRTTAVVSLATAAYDERLLPAGTLDPDRLSVLSDALEEAGCDNADILTHLRGPGPHVRGCWVVDLLLGMK